MTRARGTWVVRSLCILLDVVHAGTVHSLDFQVGINLSRSAPMGCIHAPESGRLGGSGGWRCALPRTHELQPLPARAAASLRQATSSHPLLAALSILNCETRLMHTAWARQGTSQLTWCRSAHHSAARSTRQKRCGPRGCETAICLSSSTEYCVTNPRKPPRVSAARGNHSVHSSFLRMGTVTQWRVWTPQQALSRGPTRGTSAGPSTRGPAVDPGSEAEHRC